jgi:TRAP-type C4-dicarboxylate transport system substrate-binding protein
MIFRTMTLVPVVFLLALRPAWAQEFIFDLHHFLSAESEIQQSLLEPWAQKIAEESGGRIEIVIDADMGLGGDPGDLYNQVANGTVELAWTLPGFSKGRFISVEAFELPFTAGTAHAKNAALMAYYQLGLTTEFTDVRPLLFHSQSAVAIHTRDQAITEATGLRGLKLAVVTEQAGRTLRALGAELVLLPPSEIAPSITRGEIDGVMTSYILAHAMGLDEITPYHTKAGLYASVFILAMNKAAYRSLPPDLRAVIDANADLETALWAGTVFDETDAATRDAMVEAGGEIYEPSLTLLDRWYRRTRKIVTDWVGRANRAGLSGQYLYDRTMLLIGANSGI